LGTDPKVIASAPGCVAEQLLPRTKGVNDAVDSTTVLGIVVMLVLPPPPLVLLVPPPQAQHIEDAVKVGESYMLPRPEQLLGSVNMAHSFPVSVSVHELLGIAMVLRLPPPQTQHIVDAVKVGESYRLL